MTIFWLRQWTSQKQWYPTCWPLFSEAVITCGLIINYKLQHFKNLKAKLAAKFANIFRIENEITETFWSKTPRWSLRRWKKPAWTMIGYCNGVITVWSTGNLPMHSFKIRDFYFIAFHTLALSSSPSLSVEF